MVDRTLPNSSSDADRSGWSDGTRPFRAARWLPGGHLQTVGPALFSLPPEPLSRRIVVEVEAASEAAPGGGAGGARGASSVEVLISENVRRPARGTIVTVHGLGGSARTGDSRRTATQALAAGWDVARVNLRNCGGTEALSSTLYNATQSGDIGQVLGALEREGLPRPYAVVSFSLGANQVLLHAAEAGAGCGADAIVAVNPPIDLAAANRAIRRPENALYHLRYTQSLCALLDRVRTDRPVAGPPARWWQLRSVRRFDQQYTVPDAGQPDVETYYAVASAGPRLGAITVPTLVLSAVDDPIVRLESFEAYRTPRDHAVRFEHPASGGHCGYWQRGQPRPWAPRRALAFLDEVLGDAGDRARGGSS
ncbi:MAG: alpha/beta fold hydrolase [Chloroflexi bacterium]|nr:alpha/beta fold hydrolase [Chloroflexota bacterium]MDA1145414.1 alpha/beta fold hydrolase [Chloroflexota bacterium]